MWLFLSNVNSRIKESVVLWPIEGYKFLGQLSEI